MTVCSAITCGDLAQPEHDPCCSSHGQPLCCKHYCRRHFVEIDKCSPESHRPTAVTDLEPCDACPRFTTNERQPAGDRLCDRCIDFLWFVMTAPVDDLRDLLANGGHQ